MPSSALASPYCRRTRVDATRNVLDPLSNLARAFGSTSTIRNAARGLGAQSSVSLNRTPAAGHLRAQLAERRHHPETEATAKPERRSNDRSAAAPRTIHYPAHAWRPWAVSWKPLNDTISETITNRSHRSRAPPHHGRGTGPGAPRGRRSAARDRGRAGSARRSPEPLDNR
jgi:hypothetical protein